MTQLIENEYLPTKLGSRVNLQKLNPDNFPTFVGKVLSRRWPGLKNYAEGMKGLHDGGIDLWSQNSVKQRTTG
jgi:hypothetical protein